MYCFILRSSKVVTFNSKKNIEPCQYKNISLPQYCLVKCLAFQNDVTVDALAQILIVWPFDCSKI